MVLCFAPGCSHDHNGTCKMFSVPADADTFKKWSKLLQCRADRVLARTSKLCSCHFLNGEKKNGPTIFSHNEGKGFTFPLLDKCTRKKRKTADTVLTSSETVRKIEEDQPTTSTPSPKDEEIRLLVEKVTLLEQKVRLLGETKMYSYKNIKDNVKLIRLYTGLPDNDTFQALLSFVNAYNFSYYCGWKVSRISIEDQLFLTLIKLRLNCPNLDLATRFNCSVTTVSNIFLTFVYLLHSILYKNFMSKIPTRNKVKTCLPSAFANFTSCRVIFDCTEIKINKPINILEQRQTFSSYKHINTYKALTGVAPNGVIVFVSNLYPGSLSDKVIFEDSKVATQLEAGDMIMVDKGFLIRDIVPPGVHINMPPFLMHKRFTREEAIQTMNIAKCRIHIERANARIKAFRILNLIPASLKKHSSIIFQVICSLVNLQNPLLREIENLLDVED